MKTAKEALEATELARQEREEQRAALKLEEKHKREKWIHDHLAPVKETIRIGVEREIKSGCDTFTYRHKFDRHDWEILYPRISAWLMELGYKFSGGSETWTVSWHRG